MNEKQLKHLIENYLNGTCTEREKALMEQVLDSYDKPEDIKARLAGEKTIREEIFSGLKAEMDTAKVSTPVRTKKRLEIQWLKIAVTILLLIGLGTIYFLNQAPKQTIGVGPKLISKATDWGQRNTIALSDGTIITLNTGSRIEFPENFEGDSVREVSLVGEAFFEVTKNSEKPFIIKTGEVTTKVLGTSFNVNSYSFNDVISVTVKTGKVQVESKSKKGISNIVLLSPNEKAEYSKKGEVTTKSKVDNENYLDWKNGIIRFNDITFLEASKMLSRWYGVQIGFEHPSLKNCHITARYEHAKLQVVLESIKFATKGMDYEFTDQRNILFKGYCKN